MYVLDNDTNGLVHWTFLDWPIPIYFLYIYILTDFFIIYSLAVVFLFMLYHFEI